VGDKHFRVEEVVRRPALDHHLQVGGVKGNGGVVVENEAPPVVPGYAGGVQVDGAAGIADVYAVAWK